MKISQHIHLLKIPFKIPIGEGIQIDRFVNVYIVEGERVVLIDTGVAGSESIIFEYLRSIGRKPEDIKAVLLTHTHPDHIGALKTIKEQTNCKVYVHADEQTWLEDTELQFKERPVPGFQTLVAGSCKADYLLKDNEILELGKGLTFQVIHSPGHSAGSVAFLHQQDNALISGDAIPVKNDIPIYDDYLQSLQSLEKLENIPYPALLLSAWAEPKNGEDVDEAISEGFEVLYAVHAAFLELYKSFNEQNTNELAKALLEKMGIPNKFVNPLFVRSLHSHWKSLVRN